MSDRALPPDADPKAALQRLAHLDDAGIDVGGAALYLTGHWSLSRRKRADAQA